MKRALFLTILTLCPLLAQGLVPELIPLSNDFQVSVDQASIPVYPARVVSLQAAERRPLAGAPVESQTAKTSFCSFDVGAKVKVSVTCPQPVASVQLLPLSSGIKPTFSGNTVSLEIAQPGQFVLEVNGNWINSLQLFANPIETNVPNPSDPNVIYFGAGANHVESVTVGSGKTVYIAAGAVVYGEPGKDNGPIFDLRGSNITLRGRGIIDCSHCPLHTRSILAVNGSNIEVEGVTLRDSSTWNMPVRKSDNVNIHNVKIFGWRGNSDGIDICNSRQVTVHNCFLRTFDDLVVLKTDKGQGELKDVSVDGCVLWNEFAHALSLGAELREPLSNVLFSNCDVIHDKGREWLLRVYNCDSAPVNNVAFDNIRIEEAQRLMSLWIGKAVWSKETERGKIDSVTFKNIVSVPPVSKGPFVDITGFDPTHGISHVQFQNVMVGGAPLSKDQVHQNAFVQDVSVTP